MKKGIYLLLGAVLAGCGPTAPAAPVSPAKAQPSAAVPAQPVEAPKRCELPPTFKVSLGAGKVQIDGKPVADLPKSGSFSQPLWDVLQPCEKPSEPGRYTLEVAPDARAGQLHTVLLNLIFANFIQVEMASGTGSVSFATSPTELPSDAKPGSRWISVVQREKGFEAREVRRDAQDPNKPLQAHRDEVADEAALATWVQSVCMADTPCDGALIETRDDTPAAWIVQLVQKLNGTAPKGKIPLVRTSITPPQEPPARNFDLWIPSGLLAPPVIQGAVQKTFDTFRRCYEEGLKRNPKLQGKVLIRFVIGRDGRMTEVADGGSDLPDKAVVACVASGFKGLTFPPPKGGIVAVTYPILFSP